MPQCQCQEILPNTRQQCTRPGYATIGDLSYCRLHFSFRINDKEQFNAKHEVCNDFDQSNFNRLMAFFEVVHKAIDEKKAEWKEINKSK
jgi:hypothetical protein